MLTSVSDQFGLEQATILRVISQHMAAMDDYGVFTVTQVMVSKGYRFKREGNKKTLTVHDRNIMSFQDDPIGSGESYLRYLYREQAKLNGGVLGGGVLPDSAENINRLVESLEKYTTQVPWLENRLELYKAQGQNKPFEQASILMGIMIRIRIEMPQVTIVGEPREVTLNQFIEQPCSVHIRVPGEKGFELSKFFVDVAKSRGISGMLVEVKDEEGTKAGWKILIKEQVPLLQALGYEPVYFDYNQVVVQQAEATGRAGPASESTSQKLDLFTALKSLVITSPQGSGTAVAKTMGWIQGFDMVLLERLMKKRPYTKYFDEGGGDLPGLLPALAEDLRMDPGDLVRPLAVAMYLQRTQFEGSLTALKECDPGVTLRLKGTLL